MKIAALLTIFLLSTLIFYATDKFSLSDAALNNNTMFIKLAVNLGADINTVNKNNVTLLMTASIKGHKELAAYLLNNNANPNLTNNQGISPLYTSCMLGHKELVALLLNNDALPNIKINEVISTPLMSAVVNDRVEIVRILLKFGANPNIKNTEGKTAIELTNNNAIISILNQYIKSS